MTDQMEALTAAFRRRTDRVVWGLLLLAIFGTVILTFFIAAPEVERRLFPVSKGWQAEHVTVDGRDLVVSGTLRKVRSCSYSPPPRARSDEGFNMRVTSTSPTATQSWDKDEERQAFGPWRVEGGAGMRITFFQQHRCHALWDTFTELGVVDNRARP